MERRKFLGLGLYLGFIGFSLLVPTKARANPLLLRVVWILAREVAKALTARQLARYTLEAIADRVLSEGLKIVVSYEYGYENAKLINKRGETIAEADVLEKKATKGLLSVELPETKKGFKGKGYAKILYYLISKYYGKGIIRSKALSSEGKKMWDKELMRVPGATGKVKVKVDGIKGEFDVFFPGHPWENKNIIPKLKVLGFLYLKVFYFRKKIKCYNIIKNKIMKNNNKNAEKDGSEKIENLDLFSNNDSQNKNLDIPEFSDEDFKIDFDNNSQDSVKSSQDLPENFLENTAIEEEFSEDLPADFFDNDQKNAQKKIIKNNFLDIANIKKNKDVKNMNLNEAQSRAAKTLQGPILILAGAGAGKTMTLTARIINLIESGVLPQNILAITFTNKAAAEMKERVYSSIMNNRKINFAFANDGFLPFVSTFHSLGVFILRENYEKLDISKYFTIYDSADSKKAFREALKTLNLDPKEWDLKNISSIISKNKGKFINNKTFEKISEGNFFSETVSKIWNKYEKIKTEDKALDFDDLLLKTAELLENDEEVRNHYLRKWKYIHVDEYQDTNKVQYKITQLLTCPENKNIFAVGDDDQSIYGWRGSDISNILNFENDFADTKKIFMEQNYRSTKNIIEASNEVILKNKDRYPKKLFTVKKDGEKIVIHSAFSEREEAKFIVKKVKERLEKVNNDIKANREKREDLTLNDFAVLYRANFQSRVLEEAFLKEGVEYQVLGTKFFDRAEVKDIMSYLRASQNKDSLVDLKRIINSPKRGIGKSSVVKIFSGIETEIDSLPKKAANSYKNLLEILDKINLKSKTLVTSELIKFIIEESGYKDFLEEKKTDEDLERLANIYELVTFAERYDEMESDEGVLQIIEDVSLMSDTDTKKNSEKKPAVKLMTIHASKGLEFDTIFLAGAEEALFSPQGVKSKDEQSKKEQEERRLFYVAMTRAKEKLFISWTASRMIYGKIEHNFLASFAEDIPMKLVAPSSTFGDTFSDFDSDKFLDNDEEEFLVW